MRTDDEARRGVAALEEAVERGGDPARRARARKLGRLDARARIALLCDPDSFVELARYAAPAPRPGQPAPPVPGDGVVCGLGRVDGRPVAVFANDPTVERGAVGVVGAQKICRLLDQARRRRVPVVGLLDSDGARAHEGPEAIAAWSEIIRHHVACSGRVPQLSCVLGLCVGAAAYAAALTDLVAMVEDRAFMLITGSKVTRLVTGEDATLEELGGARMHATRTGATHHVAPDEASCLAWARRALGFLAGGAGSRGVDPVDRDCAGLDEVVPREERRAYDVRALLGHVLDAGDLLEVQPEFARNLICAFARLGGRPVGVVANQPAHLGGCLDIDASRKGARFVRTCDTFGLPLLTFVDVPGYLPGRRQEQGGILPHGAKLLAAYAAARVPRVTLTVRKSYGGASVLSVNGGIRLAWPEARIAPMGLAATVEAALGAAGELAPEARDQLRAELEARHAHSLAAASAGYVDRIIEPAATRRELARALAALEDEGERRPRRRRRLINLPL